MEAVMMSDRLLGGTLPCLTMLAVAFVRQRSLGSGVVLMAAGIAAALDRASVSALTGSIDPVASLAGAIPPLALFLLARRQIIPGLRRGQMTPEERQRWILRHALPAVQARPGLRLNGISARSLTSQRAETAAFEHG